MLNWLNKVIASVRGRATSSEEYGTAHLYGRHDDRMWRTRPYDGQFHTDAGPRGKVEVHGLTMRDIRDCFVRAVCLSASHVVPHLYDEADKGENAILSDTDLHDIDMTKVSIVAVQQNLTCEIEKMMGIFPNLPGHVGYTGYAGDSDEWQARAEMATEESG